MQECLGRTCVRGRRASVHPEQARHQAAAGLHRLERTMNRSTPRRIAGGTRADPLIGPRRTEGIGAHPVSPVRGQPFGSSTGIHDSAYGRMNSAMRVGYRITLGASARRSAPPLEQAFEEAEESAPKAPQGRPAARSDAGAASISEDFAARRGCGKTTMAGVCGLEPQALGFGDRCSTN